MCGGGGGGSAPEPPTYRSRDGRKFDNPQDAAERDRRLALRAGLAYADRFDTRTLQPGDEGYFAAAFGDPSLVPQDRRSAYMEEADLGPVTVFEAQPGLERGGVDNPRKRRFAQQRYIENQGLADTFEQYYEQGLTAGDYRREQRLQQEKLQQQLEQTQNQNKRDFEDWRLNTAVSSGEEQIQSAFDNTFTDDYYSDIQNSILNYYQPQLQDQFSDAKENLTFDLARRGVIDSSAAGDEYGDLQGRYSQQQASIANRARSQVNQARERMLQSRNEMLRLNQTATDPSDVEAMTNTQLAPAIDRVQAQAPTPTPMGQVFADYATAPLTSAATIGGAAAKKYGPTLFNSDKSKTGGSGSYKVER